MFNQSIDQSVNHLIKLTHVFLSMDVDITGIYGFAL